MPSTIKEAAELPPLKPVSSKSVLIAEPESISPGLSPDIAPRDGIQSSRSSFSSKQYHTNSSRRLSGRPAPNIDSPSLQSISSSLSSVGSTSALDPPDYGNRYSNAKTRHHVRSHDHASHVISQVAEWLQIEKAKRAAKKAKRHGGHAALAHAAEATKNLVDQMRSDEFKQPRDGRGRASSDLSEDSIALEKLEQILSRSIDLEGDGAATPTEDRRDSYLPRQKTRRQPSKRILRKASTIGPSSDTDYQEPDIDVPSAEVVLDNSKTLGYNGGAASSEADLLNPKKRAVKEREAWLQFKHEIMRLVHTLRLKGWRRIPLDCSGDMEVERLSGALTNAVYVVSPPSNISQTPSIAEESVTSLIPRKPPPKLLLRVYGPQVEHLIDRKNELAILRRLARKKIGPRLLGTFTNGRFEQFFHARTLRAKDLRVPDTSRHIAKRMRELHDGIELLKEERDEGAFVWRNWDKWKDRCEEVISYLDEQILRGKQGPTKSRSEEWKKRGLVCGVEFTVFRQAVRKYRDWLYEQFGGPASIRQKLVFAHNDTQYGNLLRLEPSGESPLLLPANEHKQLVVIDFEYASANVPGLEFANHFTEWCYDYHDLAKQYALHTNRYPTPEEQRRFLKAYIQHHPNPQQSVRSPANSSHPGGPTSSISSFMLDTRAPPSQIAEEEQQRDDFLESEIKRLSIETRLWRVANSAQWVAWGIVQAKVAGMDEALEAKKNETPKSEETIHFTPTTAQDRLGSDPLGPEIVRVAEDAKDKRPDGSEESVSVEEGADEEEEDEFDYLGYAQERAMFFWGDVLQLGLVRREDLPESLLSKVKIVEY